MTRNDPTPDEQPLYDIPVVSTFKGVKHFNYTANLASRTDISFSVVDLVNWTTLRILEFMKQAKEENLLDKKKLKKMKRCKVANVYVDGTALRANGTMTFSELQGKHVRIHFIRK